MITLRAFLEDLTARDVKLWIEGENLRCSAPEGSLTSDLVRQLQSHKAEILASLQAGQANSGLAPIQSVDRTGPLPLSYAQQRLWFLDRLGSGSAYNMAGALKLDGPLNISALKRSLNEIVDRHEILRTTFPAVDDVPRQVITPDAQFDLSIVDLEQSAEQAQFTEVQRLAKAEAFRTFDLTRDPMLRVTLLRLAEHSHVLLLTMHHIAADGWSVGIFIEELVTLYGAFASGKPNPLAPLPIQYADFAGWQRLWLQGETLSHQLDFWRTRLANAPHLLALPTDHQRPPVQTFQGGTVNFTLDRALTQQLRVLSREAGATLFMTLLTAFQVLLSRYSGETDIIVGSPIANRNRQFLEPLLGFFVNTLALRTDLAPNPSFHTLLEQVRRNTQDAYEHQDLPFEKLVDELNPRRNLAYSPLVQVVFALQQPPVRPRTDAQLQFSVLDFGDRVARFDLEAHVWEVNERIDGSLVYNRSLFEADTIQRMVGHFQTLLTAVVQNPQQHVGNLAILTDSERRLLLVEWNNTGTEYCRDKCIHTVFEEQTQRTPEAIAVVSGIQSLTYHELNARANQVAQYLISLGVGTETPVAICVERSLETIVGLLGILKTGAYYVPLQPSDPKERLAFMLDDAQAPIVLTQEKLVTGLSAPNAQIVCLDRDWPAIAAFSKDNPSRHVTPDHLAYLIYTSGSTGKPKGVMIAHRGLLNLVYWHQRTFHVSAQDHATQLASLAFDAAGWEIWPYLAAGATVHLVAPNVVSDPERLKDWLIGNSITISFVPTPVAERLLALDWPRQVALRLLLTGGDTLHTSGSTSLPFTLVNNYGPTENTVVATSCVVQPNSAAIPAIGRPIDNVQVYILDSHQEPVPIGVPGELCIAGDSLARGYYNRPALTAEKFIANRFGPGALYRTGDRARYLPNGDIEFLGRIDTQLKIRGFRLEPAEIEAVLTEHPGVREAVVVAYEESNERRLAAYLVPSIDPAAETEQVTQWQALYEATYGKAPAQPNPAFNLTGWQSSYTGQPIPEAEMAEWVEHTVAEIRALRPERVLEIGCGTGLLLARMAPDSFQYWATDYSSQALQHVERVKSALPSLAHVKVLQRMADDFTAIDPGAFDVVILNSIVQYFPSIDYLMRVLEGAIRAVKPGGHVYIGDVRNFDLLEAYHASVQFYQAPDELTRAHLAQRVQQHVRDEEELLVAPAFFLALRQRWPQIDHVQIRLKRGSDRNELTCFRYQVVLGINQAARPKKSHSIDWKDWRQTKLPLKALYEQLADEQPAVLGLRSIPNARMQSAAQTLEWLADTHHQTVEQLRRAPGDPVAGVDPEALWALGGALPYDVQISWSTAGVQQGMMDVLFIRKTSDNGDAPQALFAGELAHKPWRDYGNNPLLGKLGRTLIPAVHQFLQQRLPDYMTPTAYVLLDGLPLTPNGKVDRRKLPAPVFLPNTLATEFTPPRTSIQETVAQIWAEVLGVERVGIHDNFFEAGGHSLLATQVMSRVSRVFAVNLPLRTLFEEPTVAHLAESIENMRCAAQRAIPRVSRDTKLPLSFAQARLWFLDQLGDGCAYNVPEALRLTGTLNAAALTGALTAIVERHESLRTTLQLVDGEACQVIQPSAQVDPPVIDLSRLPACRKETEIFRLAQMEAARPFDLSTDSMLRASLVRLGVEEHILLLTLHHIAVDGWSLGVLIQELTTLYTAFIQSLPSPLPALPIQYADFAVWQRAQQHGEATVRHLQYWQTHLAGAPQLLQLPTDHPRAPHQSFQGRALQFEVPVDVSLQLRRLSQRHDATLFMTLLAAFHVLMARYSGQLDVVVGSPIANRNRAELEPLVGFFVNTLALRADLSGNPTFVELLAQVRETTLAAYDHQEIPFERLVEMLQPARTLNHNPLVQVLLALHNTRMGKLELPGLRITELDLGLQPVRFDLEMHLWESADALTGKCIYNTALFELTTIQRMLDHFRMLLGGIAADAGQRVADLALLNETELRRILTEWNETAGDYPKDQTVHQLFEAQVERTPDAIAVVSDDRSLTYRELNARGNQLAHYLRSLGVEAGTGTFVGICMERSLEMTVGIIGILKAGAAYVPLDPSYPEERLRFMLEDAAVPILLTQAALVARLPGSPAHTVCLDRDWPSIARNSAENLLVAGTPDGTAYVLYTSGSTGVPKGVMMPHRALVNLLYWQLANTRINAPRTLQFAPISFDVSFQEIFSTWCAGGVLFLIDEARRRDLEELLEFIVSHEIERVFAPSIVLQQIAELIPEGPLPVHLREVITAGEQLQITPAISRWFERMPACTLVNQYGPTESHVVTFFELKGPAQEWPKLPPIGRPIANTQIYILDQQRQPVPIGVTGEIYIGGVQVAQGYLNRPELTAERFVEFQSLRIYKTGDLARWLPDGNIEYLGRADHQVKIRGMRVELGEIEALLAQHPAVGEVAVTVCDAGLDKVAVAYVKPRPGELFDPRQLRDYLIQKLPEHMTPKRFVQVAEMPLTPSGKINRLALPAPGSDSLVTANAHAAPATPLESQIAAIWSEVLGAGQVSIHDNFFDLGGHSLLTVKVRSELRRVLHREVATVDLFRYPTISALAAHLAQAGQTGNATVALAESRAQKQRNALKQRQRLHEDDARLAAP